jgi:hypothetical protein
VLCRQLLELELVVVKELPLDVGASGALEQPA